MNDQEFRDKMIEGMSGRPSTYRTEIGEEICERIACGESLVAITSGESALAPYRTVMRWLASSEEFRRNYAHAREESAHANAEKVDEIVERVLAGTVDPNAARVAIDGLKWSAGRKMPKKYGDKVQQEVSGEIEVRRVIVNL